MMKGETGAKSFAKLIEQKQKRKYVRCKTDLHQFSFSCEYALLSTVNSFHCYRYRKEVILEHEKHVCHDAAVRAKHKRYVES